MKTKELIAKLLELDPSQDMEVVVPMWDSQVYYDDDLDPDIIEYEGKKVILLGV